jgi:hypothetical protein
MKSCKQEQIARWFNTEQAAFGPHADSEHGLTQRFPLQASLALQSSSARHPNKHMLLRQM